MPQGMTDIERKILDYMVTYLRSNTYQPSIREIGERFGIKSTKTVSEHLQALADKGFLERDPSRSRGVRILGVDLHPDAVTVPCFDRLPGDRSLAASGGTEDRLTVDRRLAGTKGSFFVRARGEELAVLGLVEGDWVLFEPAEVHEVPDGGVVAAEVGGAPASYQKVSRNGRGVYVQGLRAGDPRVLVEDPSGIRVLGRVAGFVRRFDGPSAPVSLTAH
ncbi:MAG: transcriptional repressor LexA [Longimicrobiales bacterium]